jgi:hypothetical protein
MPACDTSGLPFGVKSAKPFDTHRKAVQAETALEKAYRQVEKREDHRCQVTGVTLFPMHRSDRLRREHHHIVGRRVKPEWRADAKRIVLVSAAVHALLTSKALLAVGTDARTVRFKWNEHIVPAGKAPFRLRAEVAA